MQSVLKMTMVKYQMFSPVLILAHFIFEVFEHNEKNIQTNDSMTGYTCTSLSETRRG